MFNEKKKHLIKKNIFFFFAKELKSHVDKLN